MKDKKIFRVNYIFDGSGHCDIEAENKEEAEDKFHNGYVTNNEVETGENYCIEKINEE